MADTRIIRRLAENGGEEDLAIPEDPLVRFLEQGPESWRQACRIGRVHIAGKIIAASEHRGPIDCDD